MKKLAIEVLKTHGSILRLKNYKIQNFTEIDKGIQKFSFLGKAILK